MALTFSLLVPLAVVMILTTKALARNTRFHQFYSGHYRQELMDIRDNECAFIFSALNAGTSTSRLPCVDMFDCLLSHTREASKANMASAAVALGLMPTLLTFMSSTLAETALFVTTATDIGMSNGFRLTSREPDTAVCLSRLGCGMSIKVAAFAASVAVAMSSVVVCARHCRAVPGYPGVHYQRGSGCLLCGSLDSQYNDLR